MFFVFLIVSITPAFAEKIAESQENHNLDGTDKAINAVEKDSQQLKQYTALLTKQTNNIRDKAAEFNDTSWWEFGKRAILLMDIKENVYNMADTIPKISIYANGLLDDANTLKAESKNELAETQDELKDKSAQESAYEMVGKLQEQLNTIINAVPVNSGNLNRGDVVQYKSGKYYRYLTFINRTPSSDLILENYNGRKIVVAQKESQELIKYKLTSSLNSSRVVSTAYNIQLKNIANKRAEAIDYKETGDNLDNVAENMLVISAVIVDMGLFLWGIGFILSVLGYGAVIAVIGCVILGFGTAMLCVSLGIHIFADRYVNMAKTLENEANNDSADLNRFNQDTVPAAYNMNVVAYVNDTLSSDFNITDLDNDVLGAEVVEASKHGNVTVKGKKFDYKPLPGFIGSDSFTYKVKDTTGKFSNTSRVNIQVISAPVAQGVNLSTSMDIGKNIAFNATDPYGKGLTYKIFKNPENGTLKENGKKGTCNYIYKPFESFIGNDSFQYVAVDANNKSSNVAVVNMVVFPLPVAYDVNMTVKMNFNGTVVFNATDPSGNGLKYVILDRWWEFKLPKHGVLEQLMDGGKQFYVYKPNQNFVGSDYFKYRVVDVNGGESNIANVNLLIER